MRARARVCVCVRVRVCVCVNIQYQRVDHGQQTDAFGGGELELASVGPQPTQHQSLLADNVGSSTFDAGGTKDHGGQQKGAGIHHAQATEGSKSGGCTAPSSVPLVQSVGVAVEPKPVTGPEDFDPLPLVHAGSQAPGMNSNPNDCGLAACEPEAEAEAGSEPGATDAVNPVTDAFFNTPSHAGGGVSVGDGDVADCAAVVAASDAIVAEGDSHVAVEDAILNPGAR